MFQNLKVSVVIPTLNEAKGIRETIKNIPSVVDEIVVVDADSTDGTREIATQADPRTKVILEPRRGYGRAFRTGFEHCTGDLIATADGDGTYPIERFEEIAAHLLEKNLEFVSCARFPLKDSSAMHFQNYVGNQFFTVAASTLWFHRFNDILSGMWVFRKSCLSKLHLLSDSWNFSEEIKLQAYMKLGKKFAEFHIPYRERLGETKLSPWKVGLQNLVYLFAMRTGSVALIQEIVKRPKRSEAARSSEGSVSP
ncbi:MAG: glycosyltransferase family 2 protein [Bdellovibrionota bacterium]